MMTTAFLELRNLKCLFPVRGSALHLFGGPRHHLHAVDEVSLQLHRGEILALVGESGCGKSTLGRMLVRLQDPSAGQIILDGEDVTAIQGEKLKEYRRHAQIVFQNPFEAFDPRRTVGDSLDQALRIHNFGNASERSRRISLAMEHAGLTPVDDFLQRYPHELSGGQSQRIATVRAMLLAPALLVADEPVSMLDVSVRADILNQLLDLRDGNNMAIVCITHDISVARYVADTIAVMYLGMFLETGPAETVISAPKHPYSQALLSHTLDIDSVTEPMQIGGEVPQPIDIQPGCRFANRCPFAFDRCRIETPVLLPMNDGTSVACHLYDGAAD
jgi:oligopeptide/dipeptide ABC transporter ATP-binding protein